MYNYIENVINSAIIPDKYDIFLKKFENDKNISNFVNRSMIIINKHIWNVCTKEIPEMLNKESIAAITLCWTGIIIWKLCLYDKYLDENLLKLTRLDELVILLYITSDYILDSSNANIYEKDEIKRCVKSELKSEFINIDEIKYESTKKIISYIRETINLSESKTVNIGLIEAWKAEVDSDESKGLLYLSVMKGWKTINMAHHILNIDIEQSLFLGSSTQLIDDLMDWEIDINDGISTRCTELIDSGEYDRYIYECLCFIQNLKYPFTVIKCYFIYCLCNCVINNKHSTEKLKNICRKCAYKVKKFNMNDWIYELYNSYIQI